MTQSYDRKEGGWSAGFGEGEPRRLGVIAIQHTLQSVEGRKITGRNLEDDEETWATERAQLCEVTIPRAHSVRGSWGGPKEGLPGTGSPSSFHVLCAQPQRCSYQGCWVLLSAAPSGCPGALNLASDWPVPLLIPVPQCSRGSCQPAVPTLMRKMLRGFFILFTH